MLRHILFCVAGILVAAQKGKVAPAPQAPAPRTQQAQSNIVGGGIISRQPTPAAAAALLDANDAILLLLDHQTGLFQTVKDVPLPELRNNAVVLAKIAQLAGVPVITTASEPNGSNGPLFDELAAMNTTYVPRKGEVSAWDNADFVSAVEASGKKTLIMAGVWTSVCVAFPALQALLDGYKVYAVFDASGDMSEMASRVTLERLTQAGVIPVTTNVILCEFQRTWNRPDAAQWGALYNELVPNYRAVGESYTRAQQAATGKAPTVAQPSSKPRGL
jgi:nicotinamidase-related amidase